MRWNRVSVAGYTKVPLMEGVGLEPALLTPFHISTARHKKVIHGRQHSYFVGLPGLSERISKIREVGKRVFVSRAESKPSTKIKEGREVPQRLVTFQDGSQRWVTEHDPDSGSLRVWVDGSLVSVSKPKGAKKVSRVGGKRGIVYGFSSGARRRLMRKIGTFKKDARPLFITLTYPGEFAVDYAIWKADLNRFSMKFHREFPQGSFIWRLEPQRRGAPHFHLLVYGIEFTADNGAWFREAWYKSVGSNDPKHRVWGADVQQLRSNRGVRSYVSKYIAKRQGASVSLQGDGAMSIDWSKVGRWWGVRYSDNLPVSERLESNQLSYAESCDLLRQMRRYAQKGNGGRKLFGSLPGLTIFVNDARRWLDVIEGIIGGRYRPLGNGFLSLDESMKGVTV